MIIRRIKVATTRDFSPFTKVGLLFYCNPGCLRLSMCTKERIALIFQFAALCDVLASTYMFISFICNVSVIEDPVLLIFLVNRYQWKNFDYPTNWVWHWTCTNICYPSQYIQLLWYHRFLTFENDNLVFLSQIWWNFQCLRMGAKKQERKTQLPHLLGAYLFDWSQMHLLMMVKIMFCLGKQYKKPDVSLCMSILYPIWLSIWPGQW